MFGRGTLCAVKRTEHIHIRTTPVLRARVKRVAKAEGRKLSDACVRLLEVALDIVEQQKENE